VRLNSHSMPLSIILIIRFSPPIDISTSNDYSKFTNTLIESIVNLYLKMTRKRPEKQNIICLAVSKSILTVSLFNDNRRRMERYEFKSKDSRLAV
jgi:hypothetical protein